MLKRIETIDLMQKSLLCMAWGIRKDPAVLYDRSKAMHKGLFLWRL